MTESQRDEIMRLADWCRNESVDFYMTNEPEVGGLLQGIAERIEEIFPDGP